MNNPAQDDIQRELEQRALRNVRGLVDKIEEIDAHDSRRERRYLAVIIAVALVALLGVAGSIWLKGRQRDSGTVVIDTSKAPAQEPRR
jgi:hypothetical protein